MEKQILYHGSNVIVEHPLVSIGRKDLDFGPGFYLTPLFEQASKWAVRIKTIRRAKQAIVNTYEFALPQEEAAQVLAGDAFADEVKRDILEANQSGVQGAPFFVLNNKYDISGAQPYEYMLAVLKQIQAEEGAQ